MITLRPIDLQTFIDLQLRNALWEFAAHATCVSEQIGKMRLVGPDQSVKKALIRFHRFLAEYIQQLVCSVERGWLRVDALSLLIDQVSRLIESRDESVHSSHRLDQLRANSLNVSHVGRQINCLCCTALFRQNILQVRQESNVFILTLQWFWGQN